MYQRQIENWLNEGISLLFYAVSPVKESRVTWTKPLKITLTNSKIELPNVWLRPEYSKITTAKNKVIYAQDFEGSLGGWQDEFQGEQSNSLVTRDNSQHYQGEFSLKVQNKPGSINAITTQSLGPLVPGEHYTISAYVKGGTITIGTASLRVMGDGLVQFTDGVPLYNGQGRDWQRVSMSFQARSAYHFFSLMAGGESGQYVYWDDIQLEKGTVASDFQKDKVGTNNSSNPQEDLVTTSVATDITVLGESAYDTNTRLLSAYPYSLKDIKLSFSQASVLTLFRGTINPSDTSAFMTIEKSDKAPLSLSEQMPGKTNRNMLPLALLIVSLALLLVIKYGMTLRAKIEGAKQVSLIFPILYIAGWLVNVISISMLAIYYAGVWLYEGDLLNSPSIFSLTIFVMSLIIYLVVLRFIKHNKELVKKLSEIQIGIVIVLLLLAFAFIVSDIFGNRQVLSVQFILSILYKSMAFLILLIELGILIRVYFKSKKGEKVIIS